MAAKPQPVEAEVVPQRIGFCPGEPGLARHCGSSIARVLALEQHEDSVDDQGKPVKVEAVVAQHARFNDPPQDRPHDTLK